MKAKDVMTPYVVSVAPDNTVGEVADILLTQGISAVPVVDGGRLVGIVSEGDLIRRAEIGTAERHRSWWLRLFTDDTTLATEYVKSHATRVRDIMTRKVITVTGEAPLADIAAALEKNRIKRVPVLRDGRLVGIVSRANLIQGLAAARATPLASAAADDGMIRARVLEALRSLPWSGAGTADVTVTGGLVELWGIYRSPEERNAERVAAENVPGVRKVEDHRVLMATPRGYV
ncbi:CBS domain-containing protein [Rhodospirillaceae bacterium SYSU D60014]|uniref:CBS domain-containing protein n=1 Tax=Virgifigura deserti TaxID=2268457 RepID=UPI000E674FD6